MKKYIMVEDLRVGMRYIGHDGNTFLVQEVITAPSGTVSMFIDRAPHPRVNWSPKTEIMVEEPGEPQPLSEWSVSIQMMRIVKLEVPPTGRHFEYGTFSFITPAIDHEHALRAARDLSLVVSAATDGQWRPADNSDIKAQRVTGDGAWEVYVPVPSPSEVYNPFPKE